MYSQKLKSVRVKKKFQQTLFITIAKVNTLLDQPVIEALYRASRAGVEIDLIVRGACALRPNVRGLSHRIRVRSIVGRFLEHSRICYFENDGEPDIYLGSVYWMPRNLYERVEVMFPVETTVLRERVSGEILQSHLKDTRKARILRQDGSYTLSYQENANKPTTEIASVHKSSLLSRPRAEVKPASRKHLSLESSTRDLEIAFVA